MVGAGSKGKSALEGGNVEMSYTQDRIHWDLFWQMLYASIALLLVGLATYITWRNIRDSKPTDRVTKPSKRNRHV